MAFGSEHTTRDSGFVLIVLVVILFKRTELGRLNHMKEE